MSQPAGPQALSMPQVGSGLQDGPGDAQLGATSQPHEGLPHPPGKPQEGAGV